MMNTIKLPFRLVAFTILISSLYAGFCCAQQLEWRYEYKSGERALPGYFWVDDAGNGYFNIMKTRPGSSSTYDRSHSLLILNEHGKYNGSVYIKHCNRGGILMPYDDDQYVMSGVDCELDKKYNRQSYLLNYDGSFVKKGRAFEGNYFAQTPSDRGFTYFSKPTKGFSHTYLSIGYIDESFSITNDSISLGSLERESLGMVFNYINPVQLRNKSWVLPFNYGKVESGISVDHGSVFCVTNEQITWQYPDTLSSYRLKLIDAYKNKTTLYMRKSRDAESRLFVQLDKNGEVLNSTFFHPRMRVNDMKVDNEHIILLSRNLIRWFDWEGNIINEFDLNTTSIVGYKMRLLPDGGIMVVGSYQANPVIVKVSLDTNNETMGDENQLDSQSIITYADAAIENIELLSASVFPNPASLRINFEIKDLSKKETSYQLQIFNETGQHVFEDQFNQSFYELNLAQFNTGSYIYRIISLNQEKAEVVSGKFIKI